MRAFGRGRRRGGCLPRSGIDPPDPERGIHVVQVSGELFVLIVHRSRMGGGVGTSIHQQRPDVRVFPVVVMVQQRRQPVDVIGDEFRPIAIAWRDGGDESGHQRELAPEHVVHDEHLATVERGCRYSVQVTISNVRIRAPIAILGRGD